MTRALCNYLEMKGIAVTQQLLCGLESHHISQNTHLSRTRLEIILTLHFSQTPFSFNESHCYSEKGSHNPSESPLSPVEF